MDFKSIYIVDACGSIGAAPVIIIGAGRSGTNMLRDVLTRLDGVETWPCDEINYIWRHGNREHPTDELAVEQSTPAVRDFIRGRFAAMAAASGLGGRSADQRVLVEKTCANSLRVPFVDSVVPEARYLHLVRDGRDVVASASQRWKAPLDIPYLAAKARYVPTSDLPFYASRYIANRLSKLVDREAALSVWGPRFEGMRELAATHSLAQVCAEQWVRCVERSDTALAAMPASKVHQLRYEDFVREPHESLAGIAAYLGLWHDKTTLAAACTDVRTASVGKGRAASDDEAALDAIMRDTLTAHGYD